MANYNDVEIIESIGSVIELPSHPGFIPGHEYSLSNLPTITNGYSDDYFNHILFVFFEFTGQTLNNFIVPTVSGATSNLQLGVYTINNGFPEQKLFSVSQGVGGSNYNNIPVNQVVPPGWHAIAITIDARILFRVFNASTSKFGLNYYGFFPGSTNLTGGIKFSFDSTQTLPNIFDKNNYTQSACTNVPVVRLVFN